MERDYFTSRWAFILSAMGTALGMGSVWRFPRVLAQNGGGTLLIPWIVTLFTWSIPLVALEIALGRRFRMGTVGTIARVATGRFAWIGSWMAVASFCVLSYYSVTAGRCLKYFLSALTRDLSAGAVSRLPEFPRAFWERFLHGPQPVLLQVVALLIAGVIVHRGVRRGIERLNRALVPALFALLLFLAVRSLTLKGAAPGLLYLAHVDLGLLAQPSVWIEALTHSAWSTAAGWGLAMTYSAYCRHEGSPFRNALIVGAGNHLAAVLACIALVPMVFSVLPPEEAAASLAAEGQGLSFVWIPTLVSRVSGGPILLILFYAILASAALCTLVALMELGTRVLMDAGIDRNPAVVAVGAGACILGLPSALSPAFLANQDWVWGMGLLLGSFLMVLAAGRHGLAACLGEASRAPQNRSGARGILVAVLGVLVPIQFLAVWAWWLSRPVVAAGLAEALSPVLPQGLGTCLLQWGIAIGVVLAMNGRLVERTFGRRYGAGRASTPPHGMAR